MQFQAKDIQKILNIPKYRYDYIASKVGVKPEIEDVEGTGHTHLYSLKNLLEFAFIDTANNLGIGPKSCRRMIEFISDKTDIFSETNKKKLVLYFVNKEYFTTTLFSFYSGYIAVNLLAIKNNINKKIK